MIKRLSLRPLVTTIAIVGVATAGPAPSRHAASQLSITVSEAKDLYSEIFEFEAIPIPGEGEQTYGISSKLAELDDPHPLASLLQDAGHLVRYMLGETGISMADRRAAAASAEFPGPYLELLKRDERFSSIFLPLVDLHLRQNGGGVEGLPNSGTGDFGTVDVLNVAVRFIYPDGIEPDGSIRAHICSGINGLADMTYRSPFVRYCSMNGVRS